MKKFIKVISIILIVCILLFVGFYIYTLDYSKNIDENATQSTSTVNVEKKDYGYFFDGPGNQSALIFYPGGKVEDIAYATLLKEISNGGVDCFLLTMPFNLAFLKYKAADSVISDNYTNWYICGHSLGGVAASMYAKENIEKFDGIIFLAAYSVKDFSSDNIKALSIYGSLDGVLNKDGYTKALKYMPVNTIEYIIQGGNHANFGTYGKQKGDNDSNITGEDQRQITSSKILDFILN